jgi:hypothetical protein
MQYYRHSKHPGYGKAYSKSSHQRWETNAIGRIADGFLRDELIRFQLKNPKTSVGYTHWFFDE